MTTRALVLSLAVVASAVALTITFAQSPAAPPQPPNQPRASSPGSAPLDATRTLSGPYTHDNLTIFLVHGPDTAKNTRFLTLQEAMLQKKIRVHETGQVNELSVENVSDEQIFIQSGDIVRGGKQDRVLANDLIVEAHSGKIPIASFCVEQGRWTKRGNESATHFGESCNQAPDNRTKLAAKLAYNQSAVWSSVAKSQQQLSAKLRQDVTAANSATSLQLTLENNAVRANRDAYLKALADITSGKPDAVGAVIVLDNRPYSADIYASHDLFIKLWPKLLEAGAIQAVASPGKPDPRVIPTAADARAFAVAAEKQTANDKSLSKRVTLVTRQTNEVATFETIDTKNATAPLHVNCLSKK